MASAEHELRAFNGGLGVRDVARHGLEKLGPPPNKVQPVLHYGLLLQSLVNDGLMLIQSHCVTHNYCDGLSETSWAALQFSSTVL